MVGGLGGEPPGLIINAAGLGLSPPHRRASAADGLWVVFLGEMSASERVGGGGLGGQGFNLQLSLKKHGTGHCAPRSLSFLICKMGMTMPGSQDGHGMVGGYVDVSNIRPPPRPEDSNFPACLGRSVGVRCTVGLLLPPAAPLSAVGLLTTHPLTHWSGFLLHKQD